MFRIRDHFKNVGCWALGLSFSAITAVEFSYIFGGLNWLDAFVFLLIPAFILLIIQLILTFNAETKSYCVAFTILVACLTFYLFRLSGIEFGTVGDQYHLMKTVAFSIKNNFFIQFQMFTAPGLNAFLPDFIDSIWGIFWRWTQWDFIIIILQALPIVLLWQQLVRFFKKQNVTRFPGLLAVVVIMTLEILWCQQGSCFIDSIVGVLISITLLLCYDFLTPPYEQRFSYLAGLAFVSGLCLISKPTGLSVAILGLMIAFVLGFRFLHTCQKFLLALTALPSLIYFFYRQIQTQVKTGSFFYPYIDPANTFHIFNAKLQLSDPSYAEIYQLVPGYHHLVKADASISKPLYVLGSWLSDYRLDSFITPAPYVRGNGLVFTYFVVPTLILWVFGHINIFKKQWWKDPRLSILAAIFIYYYFFPGSIEVRYAVGFGIFILSWCLSYLWQCMEQWRPGRFNVFSTIVICLMLLMSTASYFDGIRGFRFEKHVLSPLAIQKQIFPQMYRPETRGSLIKGLHQ